MNFGPIPDSLHGTAHSNHLDQINFFIFFISYKSEKRKPFVMHYSLSLTHASFTNLNSDWPVVLTRSTSYSLIASFPVILLCPSDVTIYFHYDTSIKQLVQYLHRFGLVPRLVGPVLNSRNRCSSPLVYFKVEISPP